MKILQLRFKNLNSLYGEWFIDLTKPEYVSDGIFAITGPTGAGKSTILDAICIALYGRTPRLKAITKNVNDIMSRQTGDCFAEVTFETQAGRFRCHWSQHRARKKGDGNLVDSKHEISDAVNGQILESKKRDVASAIEERTGMNFERFVQSMLLAQGGFDAFLKATSDEKAPILEQITGSEIYSEISKRVHEKQRSESTTLEILQAETVGITILSAEDEAELQQKLQHKQKAEQERVAKNRALTQSIHWLNGITSLKQELLVLEKETVQVASDLKIFTPDRIRLQRAQQAADLESEYATLSSTREQQKRDLDSLQVSEKQLPDKEKRLAEGDRDHKKCEQVISIAKSKQKSESESMKTVRRSDLRISEKAVSIQLAQSEYKKIELQRTQTKKQIQQVEEKQVLAGRDLSKVEKYLARNSQDEALLSELTGINERINNYQIVRKNHFELLRQLSEFQKQYKKEMTKYTRHEKACATFKISFEEAKERVAQGRSSMARLLGERHLREYRAEHEGLMREMVYLQKIASLEEERTKLEDYKACPLCGSHEHPYALGNIPKVDLTETKINDLSLLIKKADALEGDLKKQEALEKKVGIDLMESEKMLLQSHHKKEEAQARIERMEDEKLEVSRSSSDQQETLLKKIQPFGITEISELDSGVLSQTLAARLKSWQEYQKQKTDIEKINGDLTSELKTLDSIITTIGRVLDEKESAVAELKKAREKLISHRKEFYGDKDPDEEELRFEELVAQAEKVEKDARENREIVKLQLEDLKTRITALTESATKRKDELQTHEIAFTSCLKKAEFDDEAQFLAQRLSKEEGVSLMERAQELDQNKEVLVTRKKDLESRLSIEMDKKISETPLEELTQEQGAEQEALKALGEEVGALKQKITDNSEAKIKYQQKSVLIEAQKRECARWNALHLLIGSADGKKYRNFAQGLTFEIMVSHANRQLEKMTDRYLLVRDKELPLELNVIDNYQAGEIRSTKNLSGGESFIVSLSLALGLSKMASRRVRVDSLFLDEGFGSLDEEALETALEALSGLHQDGKLIGIISHVPALKERISAQILVQPESGGKSRLSGPGIRDLRREAGRRD